MCLWLKNNTEFIFSKIKQTTIKMTQLIYICSCTMYINFRKKGEVCIHVKYFCCCYSCLSSNCPHTFILCISLIKGINYPLPFFYRKKYITIFLQTYSTVVCMYSPRQVFSINTLYWCTQLNVYIQWCA